VRNKASLSGASGRLNENEVKQRFGRLNAPKTNGDTVVVYELLFIPDAQETIYDREVELACAINAPLPKICQRLPTCRVVKLRSAVADFFAYSIDAVLSANCEHCRPVLHATMPSIK
jgi:hypothetical protein